MFSLGSGKGDVCDGRFLIIWLTIEVQETEKVGGLCNIFFSVFHVYAYARYSSCCANVLGFM